MNQQIWCLANQVTLIASMPTRHQPLYRQASLHHLIMVNTTILKLYHAPNIRPSQPQSRVMVTTAARWTNHLMMLFMPNPPISLPPSLKPSQAMAMNKCRTSTVRESECHEKYTHTHTTITWQRKHIILWTFSVAISTVCAYGLCIQLWSPLPISRSLVFSSLARQTRLPKGSGESCVSKLFRRPYLGALQ